MFHNLAVLEVSYHEQRFTGSTSGQSAAVTLLIKKIQNLSIYFLEWILILVSDAKLYS